MFDLVIGHHAHVPQPVVHLSGGPRGEGMWVAYGLGNYLSNQDGACCVAEHRLRPAAHGARRGDRRVPGARARPAGPARVTGVEWTPITVDRLGGHQVHALVDIPGGTGSLSAGQVADRLARVVAAAGHAGAAAHRPADADRAAARRRAPRRQRVMSPGWALPYSQPCP